jgi:heparin/heparan-sulfate lyase
LDNGHFLIYRGGELAGDGGHYEEFGSLHDVNYHLRTIAHSALLVHDPEEKWPSIRAGNVTANDGGQHHHWPHHNGAVGDSKEWQSERALYDIADITEFRDTGAWMYLAADLTRSYSSNKVSRVFRQIVFIRPGTFVIFDQVSAKNPEFRKTWLLQAMTPPARKDAHLVLTNGSSRLFVQTLLPANPQVRLVQGADLYRVGGTSYPPKRNTGPAPDCRIEISPPEPAADDLFLHVLTASNEPAIAPASGGIESGRPMVRVGGSMLWFDADKPGGVLHNGAARMRLSAR